MGEQRFVNGVDVTQLFSTIELIKEKPDLAQFKFRATNRWVGGTHNQGTIQNFYGVGQEDDSRKPAIFDLNNHRFFAGITLVQTPLNTFSLSCQRG